MNTTIKHEENEHKGKFYIKDNEKIIAEMTYSKAGSDRIIIDHTEVSEVLAGTGTGKKIVYEAVLYARKNNLKIIPLCPFANAVFRKTPEYSDVLN